jgi:NAD(P)-dependent dehydrogenase (short-subunit alcohol dehydrogenase family)
MTAVLVGRRAVVTGAARGIGEATARRFCEEGARVVLTDRDDDAVEEAAAALREAGHDAHALRLDVTEAEEVARVVDAAAGLLGGLDLAVANAGVLTVSPLADLSLEAFECVLRVNVLGVFLTLKHALPHLLAAGGGTFLCTTSQAGVHGYQDLAAYCASKFAVVGLVESLAEELAGEGIRVCAVAPGITETDMYRELVRERARLWGVDEDAADGRIRRTVPLGRAATPEEVADAFVYLASPQATYVSGVALVLDAGELSG